MKRRPRWKLDVRRLALAAALALAVSGSASTTRLHAFKGTHDAAESRRALLVGRWYGENQTEEGGEQLELTDLDANGTFKTQFRIIERSGSVSDHSEVGLWGVSGPVYFTITQGLVRRERFSSADPTRASLYDAYEGDRGMQQAARRGR
jgi:hypothetical protein